MFKSSFDDISIDIPICLKILRAYEESSMGRYAHIRDMVLRDLSPGQPSTSTPTPRPSPTNRPSSQHQRPPEPPVPLVTPTPSKHFPLLALPPELRERIYDHMLLDSQPESTWSWPGPATHPYASPSELVLTLTSMRPLALMGTSRQLRKDVLEHIFRTTTFRIEILAAWRAPENFCPYVYDRRVESVRWLRSLDLRGEFGVRRLQVRMRTPDARGRGGNVNLVWENGSSSAGDGDMGRWSVEVLPDQGWPDSEEEAAERAKQPLRKRPGMPSVEMFNQWLRRQLWRSQRAGIQGLSWDSTTELIIIVGSWMRGRSAEFEYVHIPRYSVEYGLRAQR